jgi:hypothetical protein
MRIASFVLAAALAAPAAAEDTDLVIHHQGRLLDEADLPVNGQLDITVRLYSKKDGNLSDVVWSEVFQINAFKGVYSIALGDTSTNKKALHPADVAGPRWLAVEIDGTELVPRLPVGTVADAINARGMGGRPASDYALKTDISPDAQLFGGEPPSYYATAAHDHDAAYAALAHEHDLDYAALSHAHAQDYAPLTHGHDYAATAHDHDAAYLGKTADAANALKLGGELPSFYSPSTHNHDGDYIKATGGADLTLSGTGTFGFVGFSPQTSAPPACTSSLAGRVFFDASSKAFYGCDGTFWTSLSGEFAYGAAAPYAMIGAGAFSLSSPVSTVTWTKSLAASGISVSGSNIRFARGGIYEITVGARMVSTGDVWMSWSLWSGTATIAQSNGFGAISGSDPGQQTATFLASVNTQDLYQIVLMKASGGGNVDDGAAWADATGCRAVLRYAGAQPYAYYGAPGVTTNTTARVIPLDRTLYESGITRNGNNIRFPRTGPYLIAAGARVEGTGDVWQGWHLYKGSTSVAFSNDYGARGAGDAGNQPGTFIADIDSTTADYTLVYRKDNTGGGIAESQWGNSTGARVVLRGIDTALPYAFYGAPGFSLSSPTTVVPLGKTIMESGITRSGSNIRFSRTGAYQITVGGRLANTGDVWMSWALYKGATPVANSNNFGAYSSYDPGQVQGTFVADVDSASSDYQIVLRKASGTGQVDNSSSWADNSGVRVVIEKLP